MRLIVCGRGPWRRGRDKSAGSAALKTARCRKLGRTVGRIRATARGAKEVRRDGACRNSSNIDQVRSTRTAPKEEETRELNGNQYMWDWETEWSADDMNY